MDPSYNLQDVVRCEIFENPVQLLYCEICSINLCKECVGDHLFNKPIPHRVVPFKNKNSNNPKCTKHTNYQSESNCEQCDLPVFKVCALKCRKRRHKTVDILGTIKIKKEIIRRDLKELEYDIFPKYKEVSSDISDRKSNLERNANALTADINKLGEDWHRKIDNVIERHKSELSKVTANYLITINKHDERIYEITNSIQDLKI